MTDGDDAARQQAMADYLARQQEKAAPAAPSAPAPGWYPHPSMASTQRYWDGARWTDHIAPASSAPTTLRETADQQPGSGGLVMAGWPLAVFIPIVGFVIGLVLLTRHQVRAGAGIVALSLAMVVALTVVVAALDGDDNTSANPFSAAELDTPYLEGEIESWAKENGVRGRISVDCPNSMPIERGAEYHCIMTAGDGTSVGVTVSVENDDGEVTWQVD
jgi:hypothetical protein